jgi:hypothetical protein
MGFTHDRTRWKSPCTERSDAGNLLNSTSKPDPSLLDRRLGFTFALAHAFTLGDQRSWGKVKKEKDKRKDWCFLLITDATPTGEMLYNARNFLKEGHQNPTKAHRHQKRCTHLHIHVSALAPWGFPKDSTTPQRVHLWAPTYMHVTLPAKCLLLTACICR